MNIDNNTIACMHIAVIGDAHHNTLGVIRSLGEQGIKKENIHVLLIGEHISNRNIISTSKYVIEQNVSHDESYEKIVSWLRKLAEDGKKRAVVCCSDGASEVVISNKRELSDSFYLPSSKIDISQLMEKNVQDTIAINCGLHVPQSTVITQGNDFEWNLFPCITKPLKSVIGAGKHDICIASSYSELESALGNIEAEKVQIQEFISKKMEFQLIGCSLNGGETIIIPGYTRILRQPRNTNTGYLEYLPIEGFDYDKEAVNKFIRRIGYSGLFSIEFLRDENNTDYFLEINMRNDGNAYCVKSAGVNLPFIWCYYLTYNCLPNVPTSFTKTIRFIPDFNDLKVALSQKRCLKWFADFLNADSHSIYNSKDLKPFLIEIWNQVRKHI